MKENMFNKSKSSQVNNPHRLVSVFIVQKMFSDLLFVVVISNQGGKIFYKGMNYRNSILLQLFFIKIANNRILLNFFTQKRLVEHTLNYPYSRITRA